MLRRQIHMCVMCILTCLRNYGYAWALIYFCLFILGWMLAASSGCERFLGCLVFSPPVWLFVAPFVGLGHAEAEPSVSITQARWRRCRGLVALGLRASRWKGVKITFLFFWQLPSILVPCFHVDRPHLGELASLPFGESPHITHAKSEAEVEGLEQKQCWKQGDHTERNHLSSV